MAKKSKKSKSKKQDTDFLIPAGILIGMGVGFLTGNLVAWMFIGLGCGFLATFLANRMGKK